jgi:uncharacterized DUF497 family protein
VRIEALEIDPHIEDKIESKHGVTFEEVEEVCYSAHQIRRGREGLYKVFGQTDAGRHLLVVLVNLGGGVWRVATARDMTSGEQRLFRRL